MKILKICAYLIISTLVLTSCNSLATSPEPTETKYYGVARLVNGEMLDPEFPPSEECYSITYDIPDPENDENIVLWIPPYQEPNLDISDKTETDRVAQFYLEMKDRFLKRSGIELEIPVDYSYTITL